MTLPPALVALSNICLQPQSETFVRNKHHNCANQLQ